LLSRFGALIAVVLGLVFRRSFLWGCASILTMLALVLSAIVTALDKFGFK
jgi:hypothetical protein